MSITFQSLQVEASINQQRSEWSIGDQNGFAQTDKVWRFHVRTDARKIRWGFSNMIPVRQRTSFMR